MVPGSDRAVELASEEWLPYERVIARFEQAWERGERPALDNFLPAGTRLPRAALVELVQTDLEFRLKTGDPVRVEAYWQRYPELARDQAVAFGLIVAEYDLRNRLGRPASRTEYIARFPQFAAELLTHWESQSSGSGEGATPRNGSAPRAPSEGSRVGKYELLEEIGRGAFGVVYCARDSELRRTVALKIPRPGSLETPEETERFLREARSAAHLQHPQIVTLYDVGQSNGMCYLVYEYVQGTTLRAQLGARRPSFRQTAELLAHVAEAVDHAHRQGVIHRDIKPSNILLNPAGQPHIMDFGLARWEGSDATLTREGEVIGTPAYMSPEQARGEAHRVDGRSDVYSLGVVLYEMLTGELPFQGPPRSVLRQVLEAEPRPPRDLDERIPRDLQNICLKALTKEPQGRYATAAAFANDLRRFLRGEPVQARPLGVARRLGRWCRRKPALAGLSAALIMVAALGFAGVTWQWRLAVDRLAEADRLRIQSEDNFRKAHEAVNEFAELDFNKLLRNTPGLDPARIELAQKALKYYENFLQERGEDPSLRIEVAKATLKLAQLYAENKPFRERALAAGRDALKKWQGLVHDYPTNVGFQRYEASAYATLGGVQRVFEDQQDQALQSLSRACALYLAHGKPEDLESRYRLAQNYYHLGDLLVRRGQWAEGLSYLRKGREFAQEIAKEPPSTFAGRGLLWAITAGLAVAHDKLDQPVEAVHFWKQAVAIMKQMAADYPLFEECQDGLANSYHCLGSVSVDAQQYTEAIGYYRQAIPIREKIVRANPGHVKHRADLGGTWNRLAQTLERLGRREEAYQHACTNNLPIVLELQPTDFKHRIWLGERYGDIARLQRELGRPAEAAATSLQRKALWPGNPVELYRVARELALCAALMGKDEITLSSEEQAERRHYAVLALQTLHEASKAGANHIARMLHVPLH